MVTAQIVKCEISFPVLNAFVNFSDDSDILPQPQVIQISFSGDDLINFTNDLLYARIGDYINNFETIIANLKILQSQVDMQVDNSGTVTAAPIQSEVIK
jgi:hypothetical protein